MKQMSRKLQFPGRGVPGQGVKEMESFVIAGKAKTVFRLIELKAKREELARRAKKQASKK
jgi:hypothetical protein